MYSLKALGAIASIVALTVATAIPKAYAHTYNPADWHEVEPEVDTSPLTPQEIADAAQYRADVALMEMKRDPREVAYEQTQMLEQIQHNQMMMQIQQSMTCINLGTVC